MVTAKNYFELLENVKYSTLPPAIQKGHDYVKKVTDNGRDWSMYYESETIKKVIDSLFEKVTPFLNEKIKEVPAKITKAKVSSPKKNEQKKRIKSSDNASLVERIPDEVKFIKRYALMEGKVKSEKQILLFINSLQKAILEKKIRKTSDFAGDIKYIQGKLLNLYSSMKSDVEIKINEGILKKYKSIASSQKIRLSIGYLKRYIGIQGKKINKEKGIRLLTLVNNALNKEKIIQSDPYYSKLINVRESLKDFIANAKPKDTLEVHETVLNGLNESLSGCSCEELEGLSGLDGVNTAPSNRIISSVDLANMDFPSIGIKQPWLDFIGDVSPGFTAMIFGKPKMGKSYLAIDMAGYFARNHGKVLYAAREEGINNTIKLKLNEKDVAHSNLLVADYLPSNLSEYSFVFLDSVNSLGLSPVQLRTMKAQNPKISFFFVFQTTKEGNFRGANEFQHDVDVVIEVPEKGKAVQFGRFNQGGELDIFERDYPLAA